MDSPETGFLSLFIYMFILGNLQKLLFLCLYFLSECPSEVIQAGNNSIYRAIAGLKSDDTEIFNECYDFIFKMLQSGFISHSFLRIFYFFVSFSLICNTFTL